MRTYYKVFQQQFENMILSGEKTRTIRPDSGKKSPAVGDVLVCKVWTDKPYRSKQKELGRFVICDVKRLVISYKGIEGITDLDSFARDDGFLSWREMRAFFIGMYGENFGPKDFVMIVWEKGGVYGD